MWMDSMRTKQMALGATIAASTVFPGVAIAAVGDRSPEGVWVEVVDDAPTKRTPLFVSSAGDPYRVYQLEIDPLELILKEAPMEGAAAPQPAPPVLTLPMPEGVFLEFHIQQSPVLSSELSARHPEIRTFSGTAAAGVTARFDFTPLGFHALVRTSDDLVVIEPVPDTAGRRYLSYRKSSLEPPEGLRCMVTDEKGAVVPQ